MVERATILGVFRSIPNVIKVTFFPNFEFFLKIGIFIQSPHTHTSYMGDVILQFNSNSMCNS